MPIDLLLPPLGARGLDLHDRAVGEIALVAAIADIRRWINFLRHYLPMSMNHSFGPYFLPYFAVEVFGFLVDLR